MMTPGDRTTAGIILNIIRRRRKVTASRTGHRITTLRRHGDGWHASVAFNRLDLWGRDPLGSFDGSLIWIDTLSLVVP